MDSLFDDGSIVLLFDEKCGDRRLGPSADAIDLGLYVRFVDLNGHCVRSRLLIPRLGPRHHQLAHHARGDQVPQQKTVAVRDLIGIVAPVLVDENALVTVRLLPRIIEDVSRQLVVPSWGSLSKSVRSATLAARPARVISASPTPT